LLTEYDSLLAKRTLVPQISPLAIESHFDMNELERALTDEGARRTEILSMEAGWVVYAAFIAGLLSLGLWVIVGTRP
jgi:hypothetical protein